MSDLDNMLLGQEVDGTSNELEQLRIATASLKLQINQCVDTKKRFFLQQQMFGALGEGSMVQLPFHCEFGKTIFIGDHTFLNMNVTMLDGAKVTIGNNVLVGPNTQFYTPSHSLDYRQRRHWEVVCSPITIEDDVWIGGNVVITQGVTIGARSVIAANSVVTDDVPADSLYGGTPAKLIKSLKETNGITM
ncbi:MULTISPECIES: sugar O-acetyltransferase [Vibrio]|uniref:Nodulation protein L n=2 Tax=Vibrio TaxID=662 RepID=A0A7X4LJY4_9VIBR|nr:MULTISPECIES: sugar O-acetyltransferase [Vibrio]MBF9002838.1 sugar O-acetyltransferase [Vibrio nitrifigilis]MZI92941.1 sugar O-acetyltransferase [Vibrio eleionomae]